MVSIDDLDMNEVKETSVSRDKITGTARVVAGAKEAFEKVKEGDILVCGMTLPDYVPAMKKAAAIVTDEGGITCHAAIISREMKKPCIVGIRIATQVLKNGDYIEVNADKGVIKKINKVNIKKIILESKWYDQGAEGRLLYMAAPGLAGSKLMHKYHKQGYGQFIMFSIDNHATFGLYEPRLVKLYKYIWENHLKDPNFIKNLQNLQKKLTSKLEKEIDKIKLDNLSDNELVMKFQKFFDVFHDAWIPFIFIDSFDLFWEEILNEMIAKDYPNLQDEDVKTLLMPNKPSFVQEEQIDLLKIKLNFTEDKLKRHTKKFYWYKNNYAHADILDLAYFKKKIEKIKNPRKKLKKIEDGLNSIKGKKEEILKKYNIPTKIMKFIDLMVILSNERDNRKAMQCKGNAGLKLFIKEIGRRRKIDWRLFEQICYPYVVDKAFTITKKELMSYHKVSAYCSEERVPILFPAKDVDELKKAYDESVMKETSELKGQVACPGLVKGNVKIINKKSEFKKMKKGDILVSYMTRPEFLLIMKKAAAIVTNEGGITSHAAIVSRELNIPCIIGTRVATKLLKDGDLVEVDANKGIVRKIK